MRNSSERKLLSLGFDIDLIKKIDEKSLTISGLKNQNKAALMKNGFSDDEADLIHKKVNRVEIDDAIICKVLEKSGEICCFCNDGNKDRPFQIHHMEEYHINQNNNEDNLVLVCPTHHVANHKTKMNIDTQKQIKRKWENIWQTAKMYIEKGVAFPFSSIENVDYKLNGSITEIFSFGTPIPSVCVELCNGSIAHKAFEILKKENKLIIAGASGSGKSTLAYGIAGLDKEKNVYKYTIGNTNSRAACVEILYFLSEVVGEIILIIDDANTKLHSEQIENILKSCQISKQIIIVNTRNDFKGDSNIEQHFQQSVIYIDWIQLQQSVKLSLLKKENEIIDYFKGNNLDQYNNHPIGFTEFDSSLNYVIESYSRTSENVWQFIYLLGGGLNKVEEIRNELHVNDRFDIVFLFIAIKQISEFEKGVSPNEIIELYKRNSILCQQGAPELEWLKEELDMLCSKRILKNERGRYKTIHRQFAKRYIECFYLIAPLECSALLDEIFLDYSKVKEIVILWSWLRNTILFKYLNLWYNPTKTDWNKIVAEACKQSLQIVGLLAEQMHLTAHGANNSFIHDAFKDKANELALLINKAEDGTLSFFQELSTTLRYHVNEIFIPLLDAVDKKIISDLIKQSEPDDFQQINSLFYNISEFYPKWIIELAKCFSFNDFKIILEKSKKGDVQSIYEITSFIRTYILDFKRSHFIFCVGQIKRILLNCKLEEIRFPIMPYSGLFELTLFPNDLIDILSVLDKDQLAKDFISTTPRHWKNLLSISMLTKGESSVPIKAIIDKVDVDLLYHNIEKYYLESRYELRVLIYQLCYGSEEKKKEIALRIRPLIENIYEQLKNNDGDQDILQAYNRLNESLALEISVKYHHPIPDKIKEIEEMDGELLREFEELEKKGEDYDLLSNKIKVNK